MCLQGVLRDGTQVAVKSLSAESKQGSKEFLTEIDMILRVRHPNLVELIGCCVEGNYRILVYEYLENNSLATSLLGNDLIGEFFYWTNLCMIWNEIRSLQSIFKVCRSFWPCLVCNLEAVPFFHHFFKAWVSYLIIRFVFQYQKELVENKKQRGKRIKSREKFSITKKRN